MPARNPVETVWSRLMYCESADDTAPLDDEVVHRLAALKLDPALLGALWERSDRPFPK